MFSIKKRQEAQSLVKRRLAELNALEVSDQVNIYCCPESKLLASIIAEEIFPGMIIGLSGDLGSGKTTFTKYFAQSMGVKGVLNSPTFTILKTYTGNLDLFHMDVYRLKDIGYDYELDDYIFSCKLNL